MNIALTMPYILLIKNDRSQQEILGFNLRKNDFKATSVSNEKYALHIIEKAPSL